MTGWVIVTAILWLLCGILSAGIDIAYFAAAYPTLKQYRKDLGEALLCGLIFGPLALFVSFFYSGFCEHGIRWRKP